MSENVANEDIILIFDPPTVTGNISIISSPSTVEKVGGKGVYAGPLQFSCSNLVSSDCGSQTPGTLPLGVINPTSIAMKAGGLFVIRENDESAILQSIGAQNPGSPPISCVINFKVKVSYAGQSYVKAD